MLGTNESASAGRGAPHGSRGAVASRLGGVLVSASLALAACSGANAPTASGTIGSANRVSPTTASPGTTAKPQTEEERVIDAYRRLWDEIVAANNPPNPDSPGLKLVATGEMLDKVRSQTESNLSAGKRIEHASPSRFRIVPTRISVTDAAANLEACMADDLVVVRIADEVPLSTGVTTRQLTARLQRDGNSWLTTQSEYTETSEGVDTCPAQ